VDEFKRLPGIGQKSAQRLAFHILRAPRENIENLAQALFDVKDRIGLCTVCNNISDGELCPYCGNPGRDQTKICVVEEPHNILPIEVTRTYEGLYHVLHGAMSPLRGIGPEQLKIAGLLDRIARGRWTKSSWRRIPMSRARRRRHTWRGY
jgi:recombination protein RecR